MTIKTQTKFRNNKVLVNNIELNVIEAGDMKDHQKRLLVFSLIN